MMKAKLFNLVDNFDVCTSESISCAVQFNLFKSDSALLDMSENREIDLEGLKLRWVAENWWNSSAKSKVNV